MSNKSDLFSLEQRLLRKVGLEKQFLRREESRALVERITGGECGAQEHIALGSLLCAMHIRKESAEEIAGAAAALLATMKPFDLHQQHKEYYDIVGTGGDGKSSVSVSTATAIAIASFGPNDGLPIAKHGNRAVSGKVGSADVLRDCGLNFEGDDARLKEQFARHGFIFLFAPLYHSSMRFAAPIRAALKFPTIFNFLGPLCNPSNPDGAAIGVNSLERLPAMSEAARLLGKQNYFFYSSEDGYDEISTSAPSQVYSDGKLFLTVEPKQFFDPFPIPGAENLADGARKLRYMLSGTAQKPDAEQQAAGISPQLGLQLHHTVALNAAVALHLFGKTATLEEAFVSADNLLRQGVAGQKLAQMQQ
ncbi:anthranilate phosphoribosyltransferase [Candidatus Haliotispira prima]|uniref:Anthranilate phosphoribosyltransferase n=1 Tax=Candidatus Haliotispira prima TaxID=3034016 RepID=A0ABY8MIG3_9SPIO|nr:anthranilate phosphoribosyltransferase [Candidatus Haliotispira prima]